MFEPLESYSFTHGRTIKENVCYFEISNDFVDINLIVTTVAVYNVELFRVVISCLHNNNRTSCRAIQGMLK